MRVLPLRLAKCGLRLNAQKTRLVPFGKRAARRALPAGQRPPTLDFLGLTPDWGRSRRGLVRLQQFPLMTYASYATIVANTSGACFDHPFPSFAEVFSIRHDRLSCEQQTHLVLEA